MAFLPPVVRLVKRVVQKGGLRAPQNPPLATPLFSGQHGKREKGEDWGFNKFDEHRG